MSIRDEVHTKCPALGSDNQVAPCTGAVEDMTKDSRQMFQELQAPSWSAGILVELPARLRWGEVPQSACIRFRSRAPDLISLGDCTTCGAGLCFPRLLLGAGPHRLRKPRFEKEVSMSALLVRFSLDDQGQDIAEYAVMLAVILVLVVGTIRLVGSNANTVFSQAASSIQ